MLLCQLWIRMMVFFCQVFRLRVSECHGIIGVLLDERRSDRSDLCRKCWPGDLVESIILHNVHWLILHVLHVLVHREWEERPQEPVSVNRSCRLRRPQRSHNSTFVHSWPQYFLLFWPRWPPDSNSNFIQWGGSLQGSQDPLIEYMILDWSQGGGVSDLHYEVRSPDRQDPRRNIITSLQDPEAGHKGGGQNTTVTITECLHQSEAECHKIRLL